MVSSKNQTAIGHSSVSSFSSARYEVSIVQHTQYANSPCEPLRHPNQSLDPGSGHSSPIQSPSTGCCKFHKESNSEYTRARTGSQVIPVDQAWNSSRESDKPLYMSTECVSDKLQLKSKVCPHFLHVSTRVAERNVPYKSSSELRAVLVEPLVSI
jgi:hypothetical protein